MSKKQLIIGDPGSGKSALWVIPAVQESVKEGRLTVYIHESVQSHNHNEALHMDIPASNRKVVRIGESVELPESVSDLDFLEIIIHPHEFGRDGKWEASVALAWSLLRLLTGANRQSHIIVDDCRALAAVLNDELNGGDIDLTIATQTLEGIRDSCKSVNGLFDRFLNPITGFSYLNIVLLRSKSDSKILPLIIPFSVILDTHTLQQPRMRKAFYDGVCDVRRLRGYCYRFDPVGQKFKKERIDRTIFWKGPDLRERAAA